MVALNLGAALATLILGFSFGFLFGCAWHAHFARLAREDAANSGKQP